MAPKSRHPRKSATQTHPQHSNGERASANTATSHLGCQNTPIGNYLSLASGHPDPQNTAFAFLYFETL